MPFHSFWQLVERSIVARLGGAIAAIALLAIVGMSVSSMVALSTRGSGEAINLAGSLRMQSWKLASLYLAYPAGDAEGSRHKIAAAVAAFEKTLHARPILDMLPGSSELDLLGSYERVRRDWQGRIRPRFLALAQGGVERLGAADRVAMLTEVGEFVAAINSLVKQMERATEAKIQVMQMVLGVALVVTVLVVLLTVYLIHTGLVQPLRALLAMSRRIGQGDLTVRTEYTGEDELGRLGQSFNTMTEELAKLYEDLEERVRQKTAELTRSNQSLELLYQSIARLHGAPPGQRTYEAVLRDIERVLGLGHGLICLGERGTSVGQVVASTLQPGDPDPCAQAMCTWCHGTDSTRASFVQGGDQLLTLPLSDAEQQYGVMILDVPRGAHLEAWQIQLLEALSRHIGVAIGAERRMEQGRRLALLEERAVIARELHDSLAQSLAYMKIQVSRLQGVLRDPDGSADAQSILQELREGLNGAYRQLRELLTTFRLRMEGGDLASALSRTVEEFAARGGIPIELEYNRVECSMSPNEEIHVLHIVREALSNVIQHARAAHAWVRLRSMSDGRVQAVVEDDGMGIRKGAELHHYGMTIMEERARSLQGELRIDARPGGGTRVELVFLPCGRHADAARPRTAP